jgi:hypothetical protein
VFHGWIGVFIGIAFVIIGLIISVKYPPKKSKSEDSEKLSPDIMLSHIRHVHMESLLLVLGGLFIIVLSLLLLSFCS